MQHSIQTDGYGVRLRPVRLADAPFIVWLRNLDHVKGRVGDSAADAAAQEAWLKTCFQRQGDYYFIIETPGGVPLGTHGVYDVRGASAENGRHIVRPEVIAGVPAFLLAIDLAFGRLGLAELRANCVSTNVKVHSLHRKSGFKQAGILREAQTIGGHPVDLVQFLLKAEDWPAARDRLAPLAHFAGKLVLEWEKTQDAASQPWLAPISNSPVSLPRSRSLELISDGPVCEHAG
jgi:RimJ/RimL family protein N-acetyltransferase